MDAIGKNSFVVLSHTAADTDGNIVDEGEEPLRYLHGGYEGVFLPIEYALEGKAVGDSITVKLQPSDAFGDYDPELLDVVPVADLPQPLTIGMQLEGTADHDGEEKPTYATVTDIAGDKAVLDCNHPLAGMALVFSCQVLEVRPGTAEEIAAAQGKP
jgi:FKBP-type peptidyl-prolyl cis-trans isomerase SlyD